MSVDFERLDGLARRLMAGRKAHLQREVGSIYDHGRRVAAGVVALRQLVAPGEGALDGDLRVAAMFHDVGKGIEPHERYGAAIFREAARDVLDREAIDRAAALILAHCDRRPNEPAHGPAARLLQDADLLDHFGAYRVWMDVQYYAHTGEGISALAKYLREECAPSMARHRAMLNFEQSIAIFDEKRRFTDEWARRLMIESEGGFVG
ncbi:MAG: HD domain-containing protein [Clostridiales bacterium]|nr:HD domain-containing protein [Clostridiales bacterium]